MAPQKSGYTAYETAGGLRSEFQIERGSIVRTSDTHTAENRDVISDSKGNRQEDLGEILADSDSLPASIDAFSVRSKLISS